MIIATAFAGSAAPLASIPGANVQRPVWAPDGSKLSFEANFHDEKRIELYVGPPKVGYFDEVHASRRPSSSLTAGFARPEGGQVVHDLAWAPARVGGGLFVFSASNDDYDYDLYIMGGTAIAPSPGADGGASWSPDGGAIVFTSARTGEGDLYLITTDAVEKEPQRLTSMSNSSELYVTWSPDGRSLVFVAHSEAGDNLWLLPAIGASPARLTSWAGNQIRPRFAPNDNRIAFYANHEDPERFDLYVIEAGTMPRLLERGVYPDARGPAWTPDGRHIIFVDDNDEILDPVRAVHVGKKSIIDLDLGTVGNGDLDITLREGSLWVAVVAQGRIDDPVRDYKRLFLADIGLLP
ncbi:MAG TPA: hypothetical protein ENK18_26525 [Deltaproteobacteria bacterium]|nr:hypothetical protein [Deltaproteobacteria bacterium]